MILTVQSDEYFMKEALKEARKALELDEVPIGSVIVSNLRIIARGHNFTEQLNDVTAHAEMQAFTAAANFLGGKFLEECTLYVTIEPCAMCAGAAYWTRIGKIVYGAKDEKKGYTKLKGKILHPKTEVVSGILEKECGELMTNYFKQKRSTSPDLKEETNRR
jgi:tRNA(adenine34) deaminase